MARHLGRSCRETLTRFDRRYTDQLNAAADTLNAPLRNDAPAATRNTVIDSAALMTMVEWSL